MFSKVKATDNIFRKMYFYSGGIPTNGRLRLLSSFRFFTALHGMQTRSSDENSVRLSVCPSVTRVNCDKTEERSVQIFIPYPQP